MKGIPAGCIGVMTDVLIESIIFILFSAKLNFINCSNYIIFIIFTYVILLKYPI